MFGRSESVGAGRFCSLVGGLGPTGDVELLLVGEEGMLSGSITDVPTGTEAEEPVNQDAMPPLDLSATLMMPSLSPVSVGIKAYILCQHSWYNLITRS